MRDDENLTTERPTFVTHLECAMYGERYEAGQLHNLSRAGKPLLVRYDLSAGRKLLNRDVLARRPEDLWRYREFLPVRRPKISSAWAKQERRSSSAELGGMIGSGEILFKDEGRLPTGSFKARGLSWRCRWPRRSALPTGHADERQRRRGAGRLCRPAASVVRSFARRYAGGQSARAHSGCALFLASTG